MAQPKLGVSAPIKGVENFTVTMCDNGYMIELSGNNEEGNWTNKKIVVKSLDELIEQIQVINSWR